MDRKCVEELPAEHAPYIFVGGTTEPGGLHVHTAEVARALAAAGHRVTILSTATDYFSQLVADTPVRVLRVDAVDAAGRTHRRAPLWRPFLERKRHAEWWREVLTPLTPARCVVLRAQPGAAPSSLLREAGRLFSSVATIEHRLPDPMTTGRELRQRSRAALSCRVVETAVAVSDEVGRAVAEGGWVRRQHIVVCPNWVDGERFRPEPEARRRIRAALEVGSDEIAVGVVGRLAPEKRVGDAILGFARYVRRAGTQSRLLVIGGGWQEATLRRLAVETCPPGSVTFTGWVEDTAPWYSALDVLLLPSALEGFPLVLLEAMASAVPCVARPVGGARDCIDSGIDGFLDTMDDAEKIAGALEALAALGHTGRRMFGERARSSVLRRFGRETGLAAVVDALGAQAAAARVRDGLVPPPPPSFALTPPLAVDTNRLEVLREQPLVSVVIPTHNRCGFLAGAVASVQAQTWTAWECLIADDGSCDGTTELVEALTVAEPRVRFLPWPSCTGSGAARNRGIAAAAGDVVAFLDSDDRWEPHALARHFTVRAQRSHVCFTAGDYTMVDRDTGYRTTGSEFLGHMIAFWSTDPILSRMRDWGALGREPDLRATRDAIIDQTIGGFLWIQTSSVTIDKKAIERAGGFAECLPRTEDMRLWLRLVEHHAVAYVNSLLAEYDITGRDDATGDRYASCDAVARHSRAVELSLHLRLLDTVRSTFPLSPAQLRGVRAQKRRFYEKLASAAPGHGAVTYWRLRRALSLLRDAVPEAKARARPFLTTARRRLTISRP